VGAIAKREVLQLAGGKAMKVSEQSIAGFYVSGTLAELHRDQRMGEAEYNRLVKQAQAYLAANGKPDPFAAMANS